MGYFFGCGNACNESGGGSTPGAFLSADLPAGTNESFNPGGTWPTNIGRLDLQLAGPATLESLVGGTDGQVVILRPLGFTLTIPVGGAGAAPFSGGGGGQGETLPAGTPATIVYYAGTINSWVIVP
jgi:hypothetical protein